MLTKCHHIFEKTLKKKKKKERQRKQRMSIEQIRDRG